jgi:hypothetical protein
MWVLCTGFVTGGARLSAEGAAARAEQDQAKARAEALAALGGQIDRLASDDPRVAICGALAEVAQACARLRELGRDHDAGVAELVSAAGDLGVEPAAPGGPRRTSGYVAVDGRAVVHERTRLVPVQQQVEQALWLAASGDLDAAVAEVRPVSVVPEPQRPDRLLRGRGGMLMPVYGPLNVQLDNQLRTGDLADLGEHGINQYLTGDLS